METNVTTTTSQDISRIALGIMLVLAGTGHLTFSRKEFQAQVPDWVPVEKDTTVLLSGVAEIALGSIIALAKKDKVVAGLIASAFFAAVFPGNISQYKNRRSAFGLDTDEKRFARLFFQPVLIGWALWGSGALKALKAKKQEA